MNILFITHYSTLYGANRSLILLLEGLKEHKVKPMVIVPEKGDICTKLEEKGIPYIIFKFYWWCGVKPLKPKGFLKGLVFEIKEWREKRRFKKYNISHLKTLKEELGNFKPDYIYSNSSVFNFGNLFAQKYQIPHVWHLRETQEQYDLQWWYPLQYVKHNFQQSEIVLGVSEFIKQNYERNYGIKDIKVCYNPILTETELFDLDQKKKRISQNERKLKFGIVGLLHPNKGQEDAIRAFAIVQDKYPDTNLIIVGLGDQNRLKTIAEEVGVMDRIDFWGHIEDPFEAFLNMDVSLMCSRMEGMGRVTLESMAASVPVIGYKEGGTIELINDKVDGLFYEKGYRDLAQKMIYMIENEEERQDMARTARKNFGNKYTSEVFAVNFLEILKNFKEIKV